MVIYSYYYGASAGQGIGVRAQSAQLESLPIRSDLKELSSMHALESSEHDGEMLSYMLHREGYRILGLSYIETPKSSGYSRSAPCGLQYIVSEQDMESADGELGRIINFMNFQKPASASPAPLNAFPLNESGYYFHNSSAVLEPLVDGLTRVAFSPKEVLVVALPKGKSSEYATARYTIAEALNYLPVPLRRNIHFFTGLPVVEGVTDHLAGYDNAVKFGANVIFCPNEYYDRLKSYRSFIGLDMDRPSGRTGAYASFVTGAPDASLAISHVCSCLSGTVTYDSLNQAAQRVQQGDFVTIDTVRGNLEKSEKRCAALESTVSARQQEIAGLKNECARLRSLLDEEKGRRERASEGGGGAVTRVLCILGVIVLMALTGLATWFITSRAVRNKDAADPAAMATTPAPLETSIAPPDAGQEDEQKQAPPPASVDAPDTETQDAAPDAPVPAPPAPLDTPADTEAPAPTTEESAETAAVPADGANPETTDPESKAEPAPSPTEPVDDEGDGPLPDAQPAAADTPLPQDYVGPVNRYADANKSVYVRSESSTKSNTSVKWTAKRGDRVWVVQIEKNRSGERWAEVYAYNEKTHSVELSYMWAQFLDVLTQEESDAYQAQFTPVPPPMYFLLTPAETEGSSVPSI